MSDEVKTVHVRVVGRVQGVGFRAWVARTAEKLALSGWVRNLSDESVEAVFAGPAADVDDMVERCHHGPRSAEVSRVVVTAASGAFQEFEVRPTE